MSEQQQPRLRIEYLMALTELLCTDNYVGLFDSDISIDGRFTDSELRLFIALRDVRKDEHASLNQPHRKYVEFNFKA